MKVRTAFVSNSSSSSFIVAHHDDQDTLKDALVKLFKVPAEHPLHGIETLMADAIVDSRDKTIRTVGEYEHYLKECWWGEDPYPEARPLLAAGFTVHIGRVATDEGDPVSAWLCGHPINHRADNLVLINEGRY